MLSFGTRPPHVLPPSSDRMTTICCSGTAPAPSKLQHMYIVPILPSRGSVGSAVHVGVVVDRDPVLVIEEQPRRQRVDAVVVDDRRAAPRLAGPLHVDGHVEALEGGGAARRVEHVGIRVALVVEGERDVRRRAVGALVVRIALSRSLAVAGQLTLVVPCPPAVVRLVGADLEEVLVVVLEHLRAGHEVVVIERIHRDRRLGVRRERVVRGAVVRGRPGGADFWISESDGRTGACRASAIAV